MLWKMFVYMKKVPDDTGEMASLPLVQSIICLGLQKGNAERGFCTCVVDMAEG